MIFLVFFSIIFLFFTSKISIFFTKNGAVFIGMPTKLKAMWWCSRIPSHSLPLVHQVWLFCLFLSSWSNFHTAVLSHFLALFPSKFISLKGYGCLVSISSNFMRFRATIVKISCPEGRWCSVRNSIMFFLKKHYSFQSMTDIINLLLWEVVETSYFKLV